jgi:hypothetical protein
MYPTAMGSKTTAMMLSFLLLLTSCSSGEKAVEITEKLKTKSLIDLSIGLEPEIVFTNPQERVIRVIEVSNPNNYELTERAYLGWCLNGSYPVIQFNLEITNSLPLSPFMQWAVIDQSGTVYGDSAILDNTQPNSKFGFTEIEIPMMRCSMFKPAALMLTVETDEFFYEYFYTIRIDDYVSQDDSDSWQEYRIKAGPLVVNDTRIIGKLFEF